MTRSALSSVLLMAALAAGCAENPTTAEVVSPEEAQFGKTSTDTDPRAIWEYFPSFADANGSVQTSRLTGDGRDALGAATGNGTSIFQGDKCGVHAKIFVGNGGGDGVLDPDGNYDRGTVCEGGKRYVQFNLGSSTVKAGAFTNAFGIWWFNLGESRVQKMNYRYNNISDCEILRFEDANGLSAVRVTRVDDDTGAKQWTVESLPNADGNHVAGCYVWSKGSYVFNGKKYEMPFSARITEVK